MRVEIIQAGRVLRAINHRNKNYIEVPPSGDYQIRLTNNSPSTRMGVLSVDGLNAINAKDAGYDGPGYVLAPWQSITVEGWHRSDSEVARFTFKPNQGSYASQTGRGTRNTGTIGVAVFDEKPKPVLQPPPFVIGHNPHHQPRPWWPCEPFWMGTADSTGPRINCFHTGVDASFESCSLAAEPEASSFDSTQPRHSDGRFKSSTKKAAVKKGGGPAKRRRRSLGRSSSEPVDLGTGYGSRATMHTTTVDFERSSDNPIMVIELLYAVAEKLRRDGVPVDHMTSGAVGHPSAFPAEAGCPAPSGWAG